MTKKFEEHLQKHIHSRSQPAVEVGNCVFGYSGDLRNTIVGFTFFKISPTAQFTVIPKNCVGISIRDKTIFYIVPVKPGSGNGKFHLFMSNLDNVKVSPAGRNFGEIVSLGEFGIWSAWVYRIRFLKTWLTKDYSEEELVMLRITTS